MNLAINSLILRLSQRNAKPKISTNIANILAPRNLSASRMTPSALSCLLLKTKNFAAKYAKHIAQHIEMKLQTFLSIFVMCLSIKKVMIFTSVVQPPAIRYLILSFSRYFLINFSIATFNNIFPIY